MTNFMTTLYKTMWNTQIRTGMVHQEWEIAQNTKCFKVLDLVFKVLVFFRV